jgi:hypothetical protein
VQAETRITPAQSKPDCPFPAQLELVPPMDNGRLAVGVPIDVPFSELNKLLEAQLKGHHFPDDASAPVDVEVRSAHIAASGDRLLISLRVKAHEKKSWFGFGADATARIWGKPALDAKKKIALALADFEKSSEGVRVTTAIDDLRLTGIAFDSGTLRVIAEADGTATVAVSELPRM